jgi:hypothetical protein
LKLWMFSVIPRVLVLCYFSLFRHALKYFLNLL